MLFLMNFRSKPINLFEYEMMIIITIKMVILVLEEEKKLIKGGIKREMGR